METLEIAGRRGFLPLISQYSAIEEIRQMADAFVGAAQAAGRTPRRSDIRVCRFVYVSDSVKKAKDEIRPTIEPSLRFYRSIGHFDRIIPPGGTREDVTFDYLVDHGHYFVGDPETAYGHIVRFYEATGGFGVLLLLAGKNFGTRRGRTRSMRLFMEHVAPHLANLDPDRPGKGSRA